MVCNQSCSGSSRVFDSLTQTTSYLGRCAAPCATTDSSVPHGEAVTRVGQHHDRRGSADSKAAVPKVLEGVVSPPLEADAVPDAAEAEEYSTTGTPPPPSPLPGPPPSPAYPHMYIHTCASRKDPVVMHTDIAVPFIATHVYQTDSTPQPDIKGSDNSGAAAAAKSV